MGAFLEKPITTKETTKGEGQGLKYGISAMQGWRKEMEDKHVAAIDTVKKYAFFGVFDGHAGAKASEYCSENLLDCIKKPMFGSSRQVLPPPPEIQKSIRKGFLELDEKMRKAPGWQSGDNRGGTTAITVMVTPEKIIFGNCGDSRGILCRRGEMSFATTDHKPSNDGERRRIEAAGGSVMMQRVNGSLAVSRALGDFEFKTVPDKKDTEQLVSPEPEVTVLDRDLESDHYLFLACDGVYDVMTNEDIVKFINKKLKLTDDLVKICNDLIDLCLHKNSRDNMSAILITFKAAPSVDSKAVAEEEDLQKRVSTRIEEKIMSLVQDASDPLELEENEVLQRLSEDLEPDFPGFDFAEKRMFIADILVERKKEKFGEQHFDGTGDSSGDFFNIGDRNFVLVPETDAPVPQSEPTSMETDIPPDNNSSSPVQTGSPQSA